MLVLTRGIGQSIVIAGDVTVTVLGINGNHVRVGFKAPKTIAVHRKEVYERIKQEAAKAAEEPSAPSDPPPSSSVR